MVGIYNVAETGTRNLVEALLYNIFNDRSKAVLLSGSFVLFMSSVCHAFASVHCCLVVTCWERTDLLVLVCDV